MTVTFLVLAALLVGVLAGCALAEWRAPEHADPKDPGFEDVNPAPFVPTRRAGWLTAAVLDWRQHQAFLRSVAYVGMQSAARGPAPTGLPRRKATRRTK
ncbi:hypothetical protein [Jiangella asiatica]|uniref:Uncharacterized protein n=1 Tax=Jiangella asiatica TaxID=2530372 RepID=A0A4V2Z133_9ACTN|nr:hypothetical protein [Jiangella asiatica]TDE03438.1 hypothetical protein E1269_20585 [Jiangella asiatica]